MHVVEKQVDAALIEVVDPGITTAARMRPRFGSLA